jgi:hypothetical protein
VDISVPLESQVDVSMPLEVRMDVSALLVLNNCCFSTSKTVVTKLFAHTIVAVSTGIDRR